MSEEERRRLARAAGDGDVEAARRLLAALEREVGSAPKIDQDVVGQTIEAITSSDDWKEAFDVASANAKGKLWLVGGRVYRTLAETLHGQPAGAHACDFDFLAAKTGIPRKVECPPRWGVENGYDGAINPYSLSPDIGGYKFTKGDVRVFDLLTFDLPGRRGYAPSLEGYFRCVPFDVQAIALDLETRSIVGPGVEAVRARVMRVNNPAEAVAVASAAGTTADLLLESKARSMGFLASRVTVAQLVVDGHGR